MLGDPLSSQSVAGVRSRLRPCHCDLQDLVLFSAAGTLCCAHAPSPFLQLPRPGVLSQARGFLEHSCLPVLSGDVPPNLQTRLQFHFLLETSPDLAGQSQLPLSVHVFKALRTWRGSPRILDAEGLAS